MRIRLHISVANRSQITNLPVDTQILKGRTTWRNLPSIFLIMRDFDYLPRIFGLHLPSDEQILRYFEECGERLRLGLTDLSLSGHRVGNAAAAARNVLSTVFGLTKSTRVRSRTPQPFTPHHY